MVAQAIGPEPLKELIFANNGYAVIAPPSMARKKYAQSCVTATNELVFIEVS